MLTPTKNEITAANDTDTQPILLYSVSVDGRVTLVTEMVATETCTGMSENALASFGQHALCGMASNVLLHRLGCRLEDAGIWYVNVTFCKSIDGNRADTAI